MTTFSPEGRLIHTEQNKALCRSPAGLWEALKNGAILEARAFLCTQQHDLLVDFGFCQGIIPRQEGALGVADGSVRDIALLSRVGKPVCFVVQSIQQQPDGSIAPVLSRRAAQRREGFDRSTPAIRTGRPVSIRAWYTPAV